jgi:dTMP kinase
MMNEAAGATGMFVSLEGGEGAGKSTQIARLGTLLDEQGVPHLITREPGGTTLGEQARHWLLEAGQEEPYAETDILLFLAARVEHVRRVIQPALAQGKVVLCDRFHDSTRVYQLHSRGLPVAWYDRLHQLTLGSVVPDLTLLLDVPPETGLARVDARNETRTRFEDEATGYHERLREGFLVLARQEPERIALVDGSQPEEVVSDQLWRLIATRAGWV